VPIIATTAPNSTPTTDRGVIYEALHSLGVNNSTAHSVQVYAIGPMRIILILLITLVFTRLIDRVAARLVSGMRLVSPLIRTTPRGQDRMRTLTGVFASILRVVIWVIALLTILGELNINLLPFVATATVIGAALGFGAQSLVKDFLSGALIIAEDQYGVGDHIMIGSGANATTGTVEGVNLRITRVRSLDGVVWYVPNGDIRALGNDTETDSQALVDVVVPPGTDLAAAGTAAEEAARQLAREPEWESVMVGEPVFAGVQAIDSTGVTLRVTAWTRPGQHFRAAREMRLRILERIRQDGVAWVQTQS
jgi:moderate conductance mechanosensitive channel